MKLCEVKELPEGYAPIEKLRKTGSPESLTDGELIQVITGSKFVTMLRLRDILREGRTGLCGFFGFSEREADRIVCAVELGKRMSKAYVGDRTKMTIEEIVAYYSDMCTLPHEEINVMYLDSKGRLIRSMKVSVGTASAAVFSPREIIRYGIACRASGLVLVHNHPSLDPTPSHDDICLSKRLKEACELLELRLTDSIVIGGNSYFSMSQQGLI